MDSLVEYGDSSSDEETGPPVLKKPALLSTHKDKSGKVKIYLPQSVTTVDHETVNKGSIVQFPHKKKSSLASLLPQPKKKGKLVAVPVQVIHKPKVVKPVETPEPLSHNSSDEEETDTKSYLFLDDDEKDASTSIGDTTLPQVYPQYDSVIPVTTTVQYQTSTVIAAPVVSFSDDNRTVSTSVTTATNDLELNDDIVCRLAGKMRGKRKTDEVLSLQQLKEFTETDVKDSVKTYQKYATEQSANDTNVSEDLAFSHLQKRKHQITYLANQAKAREVELKNFWAESAAVRRQTKMKYGF